jgi:hypothetical protein
MVEATTDTLKLQEAGLSAEKEISPFSPEKSPPVLIPKFLITKCTLLAVSTGVYF